MGAGSPNQNVNPGNGGVRPDAPPVAPEAPQPDLPVAPSVPAPEAPTVPEAPAHEAPPRPTRTLLSAGSTAGKVVDPNDQTTPLESRRAEPARERTTAPRREPQRAAEPQPRPAVPAGTPADAAAAPAQEFTHAEMFGDAPNRTESQLSVEPAWARTERAERARSQEADPLAALAAKAPAAPAAQEPAPAKPAPKQPAQRRTTVAEINHPIMPSQPGVADPHAQTVPVPDAMPGKMPVTPVRPAQKEQREAAKARMKARGRSTAVEAPLLADPRVGINEVSVPVDLMYRAYQDPASGLREILGTAQGIDEARMAEESYALSTLIDYFQTHDVYGRAEKRPTVDEASAHLRVVRVHEGPSIRIHPMVFAVFNADHDGDAMKVSFAADALAGAKKAMDFLIGTEGDGKIDPAFFDMARWGDGSETVYSRLHKLFISETTDPIHLTEGEIKGLEAAIIAAWEGDRDKGFRSLLRWTRAIGERMGREGGDSDAVTARVLTDIWNMNRDIRIAAMYMDGLWDFSAVEGLTNDDVDATSAEPPYPGLITEATPAANLYDMQAMQNTPMGMVAGKNLPFRLAAGLAKLARERADLLLDNRSTVDTDTLEDIFAKQMSGVASLDESTRRVAENARLLVLQRVGLPVKFDEDGNPIALTDEAMEAFLKQFAIEYNRAAYVVNSAAAYMKLDGTIKPYEKISMKFIPTNDPQAARQEIRSQFRNIYGSYTMGRLFGDRCPKGAEKVALNDFIQLARLPRERLGTKDTDFNTVGNFIVRLADLRTSFARDFRDLLLKSEGGKVTGALASMMNGKHTKLREVAARRAKEVAAGKSYALDADVDTLTQAIYMLGPDAFYALGLTSPDAFRTTALGRKFIDAKTPNMLGGALYEAQVRYRMIPVMRYRKLFNEAKNGKQRAFYLKRFEHELAALASSSHTWAAIVRAYEDGLDIFNEYLYADIGMAEKEAKLNALVRVSPVGNPVQEKYEIASELFAHPAGPYATSRFSADLGHSVLKKNVNAAIKMVDGYAKSSFDSYVVAVDEAFKRWGKGNRIIEFLDAIATDPTELAVFEPWMVADAVLSSLEKTYKSSEKPKQEEPSNYIYTAVNNLINSGVYSDMAIGGDFALGEIAIDRFQSSPGILARLLSDPTFSITVYDGAADVTLTKELLLGSNTPDPKVVWQWLYDHPRAAMALRKTASANSIDKKGFTNDVATLSLSETIEAIGNAHKHPRREEKKALRVLADHPGFYAMVALATPMSGMKRGQLRQSTEKTVSDVISLLRSLSGSEVDTWAYVKEMAVAAGWDMERIEAIHKQGQEQKAPLSEAPSEDVRDMNEYHRYQILEDLAAKLDKYAKLLADEGIQPTKRVTPQKAAADLFHLNDESTLRSYFDTVQVLISAKTQISTAINGAESRRLAALMLIAGYTPEACGAPTPDPIPVQEFALTWQDHEGKQAFLADDGSWMPVDETTWDEIMMRSPQGVVIEDPAVCTDPLCPCKRHATADPSTNYGERQSTSLGRLLTIVRTLSSEGLNLKSKTLGDDGTDSITKNRVFVVLRNNVVGSVEVAFSEHADPAEALVAARRKLAEGMQKAFQGMKYADQMSLDDYINVAQLLVRLVPGPDGTPQVKVLSVGHLNGIIAEAVGKARAESEDGLDMDGVVAAALDGLNTLVGTSLNEERVLAGFKPPSQLGRKGLRPDLVSTRESSVGRNMALIEDIIAATGARAYPDDKLDPVEERLRKRFRPQFTRWRGIAGDDGGARGPYEFNSYRITGVLNSTDEFDGVEAVGFKNAWSIDVRNPAAAERIVRAYELGLTVLLEGISTEADSFEQAMSQVYEATGVISDRQVRWLDGEHAIIQMFDIRLNGGNTTLDDDVVKAGTFHALADRVYLYYENPLNEHALADSEFAPTRQFVESVRIRKTGEYRIPARIAFAETIAKMRRERTGLMPTVRLATEEEVLKYFVDPYVFETAEDAPQEFDIQVPIDLGIVYEEGSKEDLRFRADVRRFVSRRHELKKGRLLSARPGEIVAWMVAEVDGEKRFHPVRPYEAANDSGAPASLDITSMAWDYEKEELVMEWEHTGSLTGRAFKLFEALYAANKYMARSDAIEDIKLKNGLPVAGYVAKQSTASRRLYMRRQQKMMTVMYLARMKPFGYNLAEKTTTLANHPDLKARLLDGTAQIEDWSELLAGDKTIDFFPTTQADLNAFANDIAKKALRCGINPTVVFASRYTTPDGRKVPSNIWFNFQVLFSDGPFFQASFMNFLNYLMPELVPAQDFATSGTFKDDHKTLFNRDLQVLVPYTHTTRTGEVVSGEHWVDMYAGFHFLDDHISGLSGSGADGHGDDLPSINTLLAGGKRLTSAEIDMYLDWGNIGPANRRANPNWMLPDNIEEVL